MFLYEADPEQVLIKCQALLLGAEVSKMEQNTQPLRSSISTQTLHRPSSRKRARVCWEGRHYSFGGGGAHAKAQQHAFFGKRSQVKVQEGKWGQVKKKKTFKTKCEAGHGADQEIQEGK